MLRREAPPLWGTGREALCLSCVGTPVAARRVPAASRAALAGRLGLCPPTHPFVFGGAARPVCVSACPTGAMLSCRDVWCVRGCTEPERVRAIGRDRSARCGQGFAPR